MLKTNMRIGGIVEETPTPMGDLSGIMTSLKTPLAAVLMLVINSAP
jgi:hypothetical protein